MTLIDLLIAEDTRLNTHLEDTYAVDLPDHILMRILIVRFLLGFISTGSGGGGGGGSSLITSNSSIEYGAGAVTAKTQRVTLSTGTTVNIGSSSLALESGGNLAAINTKVPALGQALAANSVPVVLTASQLSTLTPPSAFTANAGTNLNTSELALESGGNIAAINTKLATALPLPTGAATAAKQDSIIALLPSSLGTKSAANSLAVTLANDGLFASSISGFSTYRNTALGATKDNIKASSGSIYGWQFVNFNTVPVYVKFYDALLANVTVGTTTPVRVVTIPAGSASNPAIFYLETQQIEQHLFSTGIVLAAVTGIADNSTAAPSTALYAEVRFK